jgi:hypothetical protein
MVKFNRTYFLPALLLFIIEVLIALYFHDRIIRPYVGDMLVVILIYCFWKSFFNTPVIATALGVLSFAFIIELLQHLQIIKHLGLQDSNIARTVIGYSFEWIDVLAYIIGIVLLLIVENLRKARFTGN